MILPKNALNYPEICHFGLFYTLKLVGSNCYTILVYMVCLPPLPPLGQKYPIWDWDPLPPLIFGLPQYPSQTPCPCMITMSPTVTRQTYATSSTYKAKRNVDMVKILDQSFLDVVHYTLTMCAVLEGSCG